MIRRTLIAAVIVVVLIAVAAVVALPRMGGFSARAEPSAIEHAVARAARHAAIPSGARGMRNPVAFSDEVWAEGRAHFADHCATCHANDGSGRTEIGENLYPKA